MDKIKDHPLFQDLARHIVEKFWVYHAENPHVYVLFKKYAEQLLSSGRRHYGAGAITERIRWHVAVETKGDDFKMGNNHRSCYARLLTIEDKRFEGFFQFRTTPGRVYDSEEI